MQTIYRLFRKHGADQNYYFLDADTAQKSLEITYSAREGKVTWDGHTTVKVTFKLGINAIATEEYSFWPIELYDTPDHL